MLDDADRKRIIDAIALLEQVLRDSDTTIKSAAMLRAIETAGQKGTSGERTVTTEGGGGGGDYGRENIKYQRQL